MDELKTHELPETPNAMPSGNWNDGRQLRNWLVGDLKWCDSVEMSYELAECECGGEPSGMWQVECYNRGKRYFAEHPDIINAIWFVVTHMKADDRSSYEKRQLQKAAALSKLTDAEISLLGLH